MRSNGLSTVAPPDNSSLGGRPWQVSAEVLAIFGIFCLHGAWPVPDSNEAYYVGKAIHFWNPDWVVGDQFLLSADSHWFFCWTFGWLAMFLSPVAMAWVGRVVTWLLLAWSWRRLSVAVVPERWVSIVTAAAFATLIENYHMAGEWLIGGVESKGFAYVLVFLGLEGMVRGRWRRAWIFFGCASAFHVLVGGWTVVAAGCVWLWLGRNNRPSLPGMLPALAIGGGISLLGLLPALLLTQDAAPEIVAQAHVIYVFRRLPHHLAPNRIPAEYLVRFGLLTCVWMLTCLPQRGVRASWVAQGFVAGSLLIAAIGLVIGFGIQNESIAAALLRFYWFRLSDFAVPMGVALGLPSLAARLTSCKETAGRRMLLQAFVLGIGCALAGWALWQALDVLPWSFARSLRARGALAASDVILAVLLPMLLLYWFPWRTTLGQRTTALNGPLHGMASRAVLAALLTLLVIMPICNLASYAALRVRPTVPRGDMGGSAYVPWRLACQWIAESDEVPRDARFLTPRMAATFKWHARRADVGTWKEIPQDARSIYAWYWRILRLHAYRDRENRVHWNRSLAWRLAMMRPEDIQTLAETYDFQYIVAESRPALPLRCLYRNDGYAIYAVDFESTSEPAARDLDGDGVAISPPVGE